jgi:NAD(P)H-nitrite reductase large subunit
MKLIIIGGGCSGYNCVEEIRRIEKKNNQKEEIKITIYSYEEYLSRPNLFFRLKQRLKETIDYNKKSEEYYLKYNITYKKEIIEKIDKEKKEVIKENGEGEKYDYLLISTGNLPNYYEFNETPKYVVSEFKSFFNMKNIILNNSIFIIRDEFDIEKFFDSNFQNIVIIGTGALCFGRSILINL